MIGIIIKKENNHIINIIMLAIIFLALSGILISSIAMSAPTETVAMLENLKIHLSPEKEIVVNNMSWNEFKLWMTNNDTTMRNVAIQGQYDCNNFSSDLLNNAQKDEIIIYKAFIRENNDKNHYLNYGCFINTTGAPVYALIEPQTGAVSFNITHYVLIQKKERDWNIIAIFIKEGGLWENGKSIARIY
ncbi:MAG: hypothetical protein KAS78_05570 [Candidatus Pacebacteria bacterium]|nr:hypothetical protein [Candidatus Paceibacterota bacterium]